MLVYISLERKSQLPCIMCRLLYLLHYQTLHLEESRQCMDVWVAGFIWFIYVFSRSREKLQWRICRGLFAVSQYFRYIFPAHVMVL
jgi:hypothetical protein